MNVALRYAARSDVGLVRTVNQDSGYAGPELLVLADGMGGPAGGDIASSVAVAHLAPLDGESHGSDDLLDHLRTALGNAHRDLVEYSKKRQELKGLGTTVIAVLRSGNRLGMVHIGDSRAYLMHRGELSQVTSDHTFVQHLIDTGELTAEEAEHHPQRSALLRVLGDGDVAPVVDESVRQAQVGDRWLLCSDGLSGPVSAETIGEKMQEFADPGACADELLDLALRAGGQDNITVVIADVVEVEDLPDTTPQIVGAAAVDRSRPTRGGSSAAARAAALTASADRGETDTEEPTRKRGGRRVAVWVIAAVVVLALIAGLGTIGYRWTQTQYYIGTDEQYVAIYQGVPQSVGPIHFSTVHQRTDVELADLPSFARNRVERTMATDSLAEAEDIVDELRDQVGDEDTTADDPDQQRTPDEEPNEQTADDEQTGQDS